MLLRKFVFSGFFEGEGVKFLGGLFFMRKIRGFGWWGCWVCGNKILVWGFVV